MMLASEKDPRRSVRRGLRFLYCLAIAAVMLGLCSRSSPLYPLNDWVDTNCFFTVGKAMFNGRVVYRDIYEQKGVLLYFLYGLSWLISHTDYLGVYLLECLCMAGFLYLTWRTADLLVSPGAYALVLPGLAAVLCSSYAFYLGGSVEQLGLALLYLPLHCMIQSYVTDGAYVPSRGRIFVLGAAAGCLLWMKFTLLGVYIGYMLFVLALQLCRRDPAGLWRAAGAFLLGLLAVTAPWLVYFGVNHALKDAFVSYFYNNVVLYPQLEGNRLAFLWTNLRHGLLWSARMTLLMGIGVLGILLSKSKWPFKLGMGCLYVCTVIFLYIGGAAYDYYAFGMAALCVPGALTIAWLGEQRPYPADHHGAAVRRLPGGRRTLCPAAFRQQLLHRLRAGGYVVQPLRGDHHGIGGSEPAELRLPGSGRIHGDRLRAPGEVFLRAEPGPAGNAAGDRGLGAAAENQVYRQHRLRGGSAADGKLRCGGSDRQLL